MNFQLLPQKKKRQRSFMFGQERKFDTKFNYSTTKSCVLSSTFTISSYFYSQFGNLIIRLFVNLTPSLLSISSPLIRPKLHTSKNDDKLSYPQYWAACKIWTWVDSIFFTFSFFSSPNQIKES